MTVIAWDGKELAGDRLCDMGGTAVRYRKVHRIDTKDGRELLVGISGGAPETAAWLCWVQGRGPEPKFDRDCGFGALMIDKKRRVWKVEWNLVHMRYYTSVFAIGSGRGEALGAMTMGASARRAVEVASKWDLGCGLGVDVVRFR